MSWIHRCGLPVVVLVVCIHVESGQSAAAAAVLFQERQNKTHASSQISAHTSGSLKQDATRAVVTPINKSITSSEVSSVQYNIQTGLALEVDQRFTTYKINQPTTYKVNQPTVPKVDQRTTTSRVYQPTVPKVDQRTSTFRVYQPTVPKVDQRTSTFRVYQPTVPKVDQITSTSGVYQPTARNINLITSAVIINHQTTPVVEAQKSSSNINQQFSTSRINLPTTQNIHQKTTSTKLIQQTSITTPFTTPTTTLTTTPFTTPTTPTITPTTTPFTTPTITPTTTPTSTQFVKIKQHVFTTTKTSEIPTTKPITSPDTASTSQLNAERTHLSKDSKKNNFLSDHQDIFIKNLTTNAGSFEPSTYGVYDQTSHREEENNTLKVTVRDKVNLSTKLKYYSSPKMISEIRLESTWNHRAENVSTLKQHNDLTPGHSKLVSEKTTNQNQSFPVNVKNDTLQNIFSDNTHKTSESTLTSGRKGVTLISTVKHNSSQSWGEGARLTSPVTLKGSLNATNNQNTDLSLSLSKLSGDFKNDNNNKKELLVSVAATASPHRSQTALSKHENISKVSLDGSVSVETLLQTSGKPQADSTTFEPFGTNSSEISRSTSAGLVSREHLYTGINTALTTWPVRTHKDIGTSEKLQVTSYDTITTRKRIHYTTTKSIDVEDNSHEDETQTSDSNISPDRKETSITTRRDQLVNNMTSKATETHITGVKRHVPTDIVLSLSHITGVKRNVPTDIRSSPTNQEIRTTKPSGESSQVSTSSSSQSTFNTATPNTVSDNLVVTAGQHSPSPSLSHTYLSLTNPISGLTGGTRSSGPAYKDKPAVDPTSARTVEPTPMPTVESVFQVDYNDSLKNLNTKHFMLDKNFTLKSSQDISLLDVITQHNVTHIKTKSIPPDSPSRSTASDPENTSKSITVAEKTIGSNNVSLKTSSRVNHNLTRIDSRLDVTHMTSSDIMNTSPDVTLPPIASTNQAQGTVIKTFQPHTSKSNVTKECGTSLFNKTVAPLTSTTGNSLQAMTFKPTFNHSLDVPYNSTIHTSHTFYNFQSPMTSTLRILDTAKSIPQTMSESISSIATDKSPKSILFTQSKTSHPASNNPSMTKTTLTGTTHDTITSASTLSKTSKPTLSSLTTVRHNTTASMKSILSKDIFTKSAFNKSSPSDLETPIKYPGTSSDNTQTQLTSTTMNINQKPIKPTSPKSLLSIDSETTLKPSYTKPTPQELSTKLLEPGDTEMKSETTKLSDIDQTSLQSTSVTFFQILLSSYFASTPAAKLTPTTATKLIPTTATKLTPTTATKLTPTTATKLTPTTATKLTPTTATKLTPTTATKLTPTTATKLTPTTATKLTPTTATKPTPTTATKLTPTKATPVISTTSDPVTSTKSPSTSASAGTTQTPTSPAPTRPTATFTALTLISTAEQLTSSATSSTAVTPAVTTPVKTKETLFTSRLSGTVLLASTPASSTLFTPTPASSTPSILTSYSSATSMPTQSISTPSMSTMHNSTMSSVSLKTTSSTKSTPASSTPSSTTSSKNKSSVTTQIASTTITTITSPTSASSSITKPPSTPSSSTMSTEPPSTPSITTTTEPPTTPSISTTTETPTTPSITTTTEPPTTPSTTTTTEPPTTPSITTTTEPPSTPSSSTMSTESSTTPSRSTTAEPPTTPSITTNTEPPSTQSSSTVSTEPPPTLSSISSDTSATITSPKPTSTTESSTKTTTTPEPLKLGSPCHVAKDTCSTAVKQSVCLEDMCTCVWFTYPLDNFNCKEYSNADFRESSIVNVFRDSIMIQLPEILATNNFILYDRFISWSSTEGAGLVKANQSNVYQLTNLRPGTTYTVQVVITIRSPHDSYRMFNLTFPAMMALTDPPEPGQIENNSDLVDIVIFKPPNGKFDSCTASIVELSYFNQSVGRTHWADFNCTHLNTDGLKPGVNYFVGVCVNVSDGGQQKKSSPWKFYFVSLSEGDPGKVERLSIFNITSKSVMVTWLQPKLTNGYLTAYQVTLRSDNNWICTTVLLWNSTNSFTVAPLITGGQAPIEECQLTQEGRLENVKITLLNLTLATDYVLSVSAHNRFHIGEETSRKLTTASEDPMPPTNVQSSSRTNTSVVIRWTPPSRYPGPTNYVIEIINTTRALYYVQGYNSSSIAINNLPPGACYSVQVSSNTSTSRSAPVLLDCVCTLESKPGGVKSLSATSQQESIQLTWTTPDQLNGRLLGYVIYICANDVCRNETLIPNNLSLQAQKIQMNVGQTCTVSASMTWSRMNKYTAQKLLSCEQYDISVAAFNGAGAGALSKITAKTATPVPSEPRFEPCTSHAPGSLTFRWLELQRTKCPISYSLTLLKGNFLSSSTNNGYTVANRTVTSSTSIQFDQLTIYWPYRLLLTASTTSGSSGSVQSDICRSQSDDPGPVRNVTISHLSDNSYVNVTWECPAEQDRHGEISEFEVSLTVMSTSRHDLVEGLVKKTVQAGSSPCQQTYSLTARIFPQVVYRLQIRAKVKDVDKLGIFVNKRISFPAQDPPDQVNKWPDFYSTHLTWSQAKVKSFAQKYRATDDVWEKRVLLSQTEQISEVNFTVGDNTSCDTSNKFDYCNGPLPPGTYFRLELFSCTVGGCTSVSLPRLFYSAATHHESFSDTVVIGGAVGGMTLALVVLVIVVVIRLRSKLSKPGGQKKTNEMSQAIALNDIEVCKDDGKSKPIKIREFESTVLKLTANDNALLNLEYQELDELSPIYTMDVGSDLDHRADNRWTNIIPFDHSRVKLKVIPEDPHAQHDYINANFISGTDSTRDYIATQGPLARTVTDFWRMAWEQKVSIIVMLSAFEEMDKRTSMIREKVARYYPDDAETNPVQYGHMMVTRTGKLDARDWEIRTLKLTSTQEKKSRFVKHFFFKYWSDHEADINPQDLIEFVRVVRTETSNEPPSPLVVHCSAGVGRTGTFIAVDYFNKLISRMKQRVDKGASASEMDSWTVDIFGRVLSMREKRRYMVQSRAQYVFIYQAVNVLLTQAFCPGEHSTDKHAGQRESSGSAREDAVYDDVESLKGQVHVNIEPTSTV
ncbi:hypothetical protein Btru_000938 [Bulinus truncatus]|nr:hypothetical protein Btru_000938 [Bulinus truncatus]